MFQLLKKNRRLLAVYILNLIVFLAFSGFYMWILIMKASAARSVLLNQTISVGIQFWRSLSLEFLTFFVLLLQVVLISALNRKYLQSKKQVVLVNVLLCVSLLILIAFQLFPMLSKLRYCLTIVHSQNVLSGECATFIENSKVIAVYGIAIFYLFLYSINATLIQLLLFSKYSKLKVMMIASIALATTGLLLILPKRPALRQNSIQLQQLPRQVIFPIRMELKPQNPFFDPIIHSLPTISVSE